MRDTNVNKVLYVRRSGGTNAGMGRNKIDFPEQFRLRGTRVRNANELDERVVSGNVLLIGSLLKGITNHSVTPCRQLALEPARTNALTR